MNWLFFALLNASGETLKDLCSKQGVSSVNSHVVSWCLAAFSLPFLLPLVMREPLAELGPNFWPALMSAALLHALATTLYMKAVQASDLSVTVPMVMLTPLFLLLTSPIMIGEFPRPLGILGTGAIVMGGYLLNISRASGGFMGPIRALWREPGPRLMILVSFIWSITGNIDRIGLNNSPPIFWGFALHVAIAAILFMPMLRTAPGAFKQIAMHMPVLLGVGGATALMIYAHLTAVEMTLVVYVVATKRVSVLMTILLSYFIYKERRIKERLLGAAVMLAGVFLIAAS